MDDQSQVEVKRLIYQAFNHIRKAKEQILRIRDEKEKLISDLGVIWKTLDDASNLLTNYSTDRFDKMPENLEGYR